MQIVQRVELFSSLLSISSLNIHGLPIELSRLLPVICARRDGKEKGSSEGTREKEEENSKLHFAGSLEIWGSVG